MSIIQGNAKQGSTRGFYNFPLEQSLRFNDDDNAYLSWTPASAGNRKTWTWSGWVKRSKIGSYYMILASDNNDYIRFDPDTVGMQSGNTAPMNVKTTAVLRDPSAWYHLVFALDTTQSTASDRFKIYINGTQATDFSATTYPALNAEFNINNTTTQYLGRRFSPAEQYFDGYMAEVNFIDGTALDASSFGELKNGVWIPKNPSGLTYGTNGFRLSFADDAEVEAFNTLLYRGSGSQQSITGMGFKPDLLWIKNRDTANNHQLMNSVIGVPNNLESNTTDAEDTTNRVSSLDNDGFTVEGSYSFTNQSGQSYVAWGWKAGDSNVSNTDGSITSTVRANTTYGFSIVSYTGTGANATIGHGLGATPDWIIVKNRDRSANWTVWHNALNQNQILELSTSAAVQTDNIFWNNTLPTSTVFAVAGPGDNSTNASGEDIIAYCWAEKAGYSKFGSYTGTGSNLTINFGFRPAFFLTKSSSAGDPWIILDGTRETTNDRNFVLQPNSSAVEDTDNDDVVEFTDTGVVIKSTSGWSNRSGIDYIYAAFADTREAAFWLDQSGNDNDWQPVNLDHNDTVADSPTDNFATLNPLNNPMGATMSDGNLKAVNVANDKCYFSTMAMKDNKYYFEVTLTNQGNRNLIGIINTDVNPATTNPTADCISMYAHQGNDRERDENGEGASSSTGTWVTGDVITFAVDLSAGKIWVGKNAAPNVAGTPDKSDLDTSLSYYVFCQEVGATVSTNTFNFGQQPFKYDPPA